MKVLITGSSGYLGRILVQYFCNRETEVVGVDITGSSSQADSRFYKFFNCSITDREAMESLMVAESPDTVIHLACSFNKLRDAEHEYRNDVWGSELLLDLSGKVPSVKQFIFSSSATAYGGCSDNREWITEEDPLRPGEYRYGRNKMTIESILQSKKVRSDLRVTILRICTVIDSTYQKPRSVVSILIKARYLPSCFSRSRIQFLHSTDMAELFWRIVQDMKGSGVFNMAPDSFSDIGEIRGDIRYFFFPLPLLRGILKVLWKVKILNLSPSALNNAVYPIIMNPRKLLSRYGYTPRYTSTEAFRETMQRNMLPAGTIL